MSRYRAGVNPTIALTVTLIAASLAGCAQPTPVPTTLPPAPTALPLPTPTAEPTATMAPITYPAYADKIGADLGGAGDRGLEFIDVAKTLRPWETIQADSCPENDQACRLAPLDEHGWPTTDARTVFFDLRPFGAWWGSDPSKCPLCQDGDYQIDVSGTYRLSFQGQAVLTAAEGAVDVRNQVYGEATNTTTADVVVAPGQGLLFVNFVDTRRTPDSPLHSGITGVHLVRPGFPAGTSETFHPQFVQALAPFRVLRFMNWVGGNDINPPYEATDNTLEWAERKRPEELQVTREGVAWEYVIELANLAHKDIWINVPVHASDDYVRGLASLLKETLDPSLTIYVEYSNEVWNYLFSQATYNQAAAEAEVAAGNSPLDNDGTADPDVWRMRRHTKRLVEISTIFREVFRDEAINNRVRVVHSWQIVMPQQYEQQLQWVNDTYGPPSQFLYAVAGARYFNIPPDFPPDRSVNAILNTLLESSDGGVQERAALKNVADEYGLRLAFYEGGPDTAGPLQWERPTALLWNCIAAHRDPRMGGLVIHDVVNNWFAHPQVQGDVFIYFTLQSAYSRWGMWGATEDITRLDYPKYQALAYLAGLARMAPPTPLNLTLESSADQVTLQWDASYGAAYYVVKRKTAAGEYAPIAQVNATTFTDTGLDNPKSYFYVVSAADADGESADSYGMSASYYQPPTPTPRPASVPVEARFAGTPPVVDGSVDEMWATAMAYPLLHQVAGEVSDENDLAASVSLLWDADYLYVLFDVQDDALYSVPGLNDWDYDSAEVYVDGGNEKGPSYDGNDDQLVLLLDSTRVWAQRGRGDGVEYRTARSGAGYVVEARVPWTNFKVTPAEGTVIGFDAHVNDDDDGTGRQGKIALFAAVDQSWTDPGTFGEMVLEE